MAKPTDEHIKETVDRWNEAYGQLGREMRLKDLSPDGYEAEVGNEILLVCESVFPEFDRVDLALAVFRHSDCIGGWMAGNVEQWLERQRPGAVTVVVTPEIMYRIGLAIENGTDEAQQRKTFGDATVDWINKLHEENKDAIAAYFESLLRENPPNRY
jgi:hypothetical protein